VKFTGSQLAKAGPRENHRVPGRDKRLLPRHSTFSRLIFTSYQKHRSKKPPEYVFFTSHLLPMEFKYRLPATQFPSAISGLPAVSFEVEDPNRLQMGSSLLRLENYRSYIIFVDLNYKAFQTFLDTTDASETSYGFCYSNMTFSGKESWKFHINPQLLKQKFSFPLKRGVSSRGDNGQPLRWETQPWGCSGRTGVSRVLTEVWGSAAANPTAPDGRSSACTPHAACSTPRSLLLSGITPFRTSTSQVLSQNKTAQFLTLLPHSPLPNI